MSVISFIDKDRSWFKAKVGVDCDTIPRNISFSARELHEEGLIVVHDCLKDENFNNNPLVTGPEGIRFFAGYVIGQT